MLDHVSIFSQSGSVLWSRSLCKLRGNPVDALVKTVLLEERTGRKEFNYDAYQMRWTLENKLNLVLVVVYQKVLQLLYVDELLERLKNEVVAQFQDEILTRTPIAFDENFDRILRDVESNYMKSKRSINNPPALSSKKNGAARADTNSDGTSKASEDGEHSSTSADELDRLKHELKLVGPSKQTKTMRTGPRPSKFNKDAKKSSESKANAKKPALSYDIKTKISKKDIEKYDRSKAVDEEEEKAMLDAKRRENIGDDTMSDNEEDDESEQSSSDAGSSWSFGQTRLGDFLQKVSGNKVLAREDLVPVLDQFRQTLMSKNVASEVAEELCESVLSTMIGKRLESFTRIQTVVQKALETALLRILTPKKSTDVLREVMAAREAGRCYSIVFVGVNGVGKSTSLSKVCYYLKSRGVKVMIAACDTFRSGAVEQLNQHCKVLDVPLFERGYAKDPAAVAREAIAHGNENGFDCVLIDTAGRMQNNEPLMRALAKLVSVNNPDLVLFVGEALVGNDGIDQLSLFDRALVDYSDRQEPRRIDGIVITKFDTIDDKVGAAVSMVYKTGQPIMFVGTGQKQFRGESERMSEDWLMQLLRLINSPAGPMHGIMVRPVGTGGVVDLTNEPDDEIETTVGNSRKRKRVVTKQHVPPVTRSDGKLVRLDPDYIKSAECTQICMDNQTAMENYMAHSSCPICLDQFDTIASTSCGHIFCLKCIDNAARVNSRCPLCQTPIQNRSIHLLHI